jgi:hypothetical protein
VADLPAAHTIVDAIRIMQERFPWQVSISLDRYHHQEQAIERWLAENFDGDGLVTISHPEAVTRFEFREGAGYCSMGAGHYAFKDQAWGASFRLFFS